MAVSEFNAALNQVAAERGISVESVVEAIKTALIAAYKKDFPGTPTEDIEPKLDMITGEMDIFLKGIRSTPSGFGRIAAQTAKQVILQDIRETEKESIISEYRKKIGTIVSGYIFRVDRNLAILDLGRAQGIMPVSEQVPTERYNPNKKIKVLIKEIKEGPKGEEVIVSRADPKFVEALFELEVPEIQSGVVKINTVAREAGGRTKMAVSSSDEKVDPIGACVGQKGVRVQSIVAELGDEKIDIIDYSEDIGKFISSALSPAKVVGIDVDKKTRESTVTVPDDQLSLAIGKDGQNVRLAAKITGWKIDIKGDGSNPEAAKPLDKKAIKDKVDANTSADDKKETEVTEKAEKKSKPAKNKKKKTPADKS